MRKILILTLLSWTWLTAKAQTFSSDVAELFYRHCTECHRTGGIAPFNLVTYTDVTNYAGGIYDAVALNRMPPWPPDDNYSALMHSRAMPADEKQMLLDWLTNGMPQGNAAETPPPPVYPEGSLLGPGDLELQIPTYTSNATALQDDYVCFSIPAGLLQNKKIRAMEIVPGNRAIVHHCLIYVDESGNYQTNTSGFCTGPAGNDTKLAGGYTPGSTPLVFPSTSSLKMGLTIPVGSNIVFAMHYPAGSGGQQDSTKVIFHFYPDNTPGIREVLANPVLFNANFVLPPNEFTTVTAQQNIPANISVFSIFPHMHLLGKSIKAYATHQNDTIPLINIPNWDFHWQNFYVLQNLVKLPQGSVLRGEGVYDNTTTNVHNPNNPPISVMPGLNTTDEMFIYYGHFMPYLPGDENIDLEEAMALSLESYFQDEMSVIAVYPNPFSTQMTVDLSKIKSNQLSVAIYNTQGKLVRHLTPDEANDKIFSWDGTNNYGSNAANGVYYISVLSDGLNTWHRKIVKQ